MKQLFDIDGLSELERVIMNMDERTLRTELTTRYLQLVEYTNAREWNELVRICEIFSIIGWGSLERVNASCAKSLNQWNTRLENKHAEPRFLQGTWIKRKNGYTMFNPVYFHSPDKPDKPSVCRKDYPPFPETETECPACNLVMQRNKQKMNPIIFGGIYMVDSKIKSTMLAPILRELRTLLNYNLTPELYGEGINKINIRYVTARPGQKGITRLERGTYYPRREVYDCDAFIGEDFAELREPERKQQIKQLMKIILDELNTKVSKRKLEYNTELLATDVMREIDKWISVN